VLGAVPGADQLGHAELRDRESLAAGADDQHRDDRERERDLDREVGAAAALGGELDRPADALDVRPHHVHPDPAAGDARHLLGRGKTGPEDELENPLRGHRG
jgi:hypothetical protein